MGIVAQATRITPRVESAGMCQTDTVSCVVTRNCDYDALADDNYGLASWRRSHLAAPRFASGNDEKWAEDYEHTSGVL